MNLQKYTQNQLKQYKIHKPLQQNIKILKLNNNILLYTLLTQQDGLIPQLLINIGVNINGIVNKVQEEIAKIASCFRK